MKAVEQRSPRAQRAGTACHICGKACDSMICDACSERIRLEALARKKREEQGNAWSPWE